MSNYNTESNVSTLVAAVAADPSVVARSAAVAGSTVMPQTGSMTAAADGPGDEAPNMGKAFPPN